MISVDTNIVVRLLTRDDETQFQKAYELFSSQDVYLCETVILETEWVLRYAYSFSVSEIVSSLRKMTQLPNIRVSAPKRIEDALDWHEKGMDFADALHLAGSQHIAERFATFDKQLVKSSVGLGACLSYIP